MLSSKIDTTKNGSLVSGNNLVGSTVTYSSVVLRVS